MNKKTLLLLAAAGLAYYLFTQKKSGTSPGVSQAELDAAKRMAATLRQDGKEMAA